MTWEKPKKGGYEHKGHECSWSYQGTGRSIAQMTKAQCTGLSLVNISVRVFLQKWTLEPKSLLKCIQNYPGHIYSIESKTSNKTFPNQSLMHLCHLVNKNKSKWFCEREDRSWPPQKCLQTSSQECFGGSLGYCFCPSLMDCQFQTLEGLQMNVTW